MNAEPIVRRGSEVALHLSPPDLDGPGQVQLLDLFEQRFRAARAASPNVTLYVPPLRPDPRISTTRPAWLAATDWRDRLDALGDADIAWIQDEWAAAGGPDRVDDADRYGIWPLLLAAVVIAVVALVVEVVS